MNNTIRKKLTRQDWKQKDCFPTVNDPIAFLKNLSLLRRSFLNTFIKRSYRYHDFSPNQTTLGKYGGIVRETANRNLKIFKDAGFIVSNYRHMSSCQYKLSSWFNNPQVISELRHYFPALRGPLMLSLLLALSNRAIEGSVTQKKVLNSSSYYQVSYDTCVARATSLLNSSRKGLSDLYKNMLQGENKVNYKIPEAIKEVKSIQLTKWGEIALTAFPDNGIRWADYQLSNQKQKKDPFTYLLKLCSVYCRDHNIRPDWELTRHLAAYYDMPLKPEFFIKKEIKYPEKKRTSFKASYIPIATDERDKKYYAELEQKKKNCLDKILQDLHNADEDKKNRMNYFMNIIGLQGIQ